MTTLTQALAHRCSADWAGAFDAAQRAALTATVRTAFIDTAACVLAGRSEPAAQRVAQWAGRRAAGPVTSSVLFGPARTDADTAALINATAGHALDFDDVGLAGHPSVVLVPALMAEAERTGATGFAVVQAYAKGYAVWGELQRRMRVSLHARGWHPSAVFGAVASAAAVASLRGLGEREYADALGIAASLAGGVVANFGSMTKPLQVGRAAQAGLQAAALAQAGVDASADALDGRAGLLAALAGGPGHVDLSEGLPEDFAATLLLRRPGLKKYPVCYAAHRCIDGLLGLRAQHGFAADEVESIEATISETTAGVLRHHAPASEAEARFSMEFTLAAALVFGQVGIAEVCAASLEDPRVRDAMRRVRTSTVQTSCPLEPSFAYADQVRVTLRDGRCLDSGPIRFARGHAELPLSGRQLQDKLFACVSPAEQGLARRVEEAIDTMLA